VSGEIKTMWTLLRGQARNAPCECGSGMPWSSWHSPDCPRKLAGDRLKQERQAARQVRRQSSREKRDAEVKQRREQRAEKVQRRHSRLAISDRDYSVHGGFKGKRAREARGSSPGSAPTKPITAPTSAGATMTQPPEEPVTEIKSPQPDSRPEGWPSRDAKPKPPTGEEKLLKMACSLAEQHDLRCSVTIEGNGGTSYMMVQPRNSASLTAVGEVFARAREHGFAASWEAGGSVKVER
jgi:hypothetical protein